MDFQEIDVLSMNFSNHTKKINPVSRGIKTSFCIALHRTLNIQGLFEKFKFTQCSYVLNQTISRQNDQHVQVSLLSLSSP